MDTPDPPDVRTEFWLVSTTIGTDYAVTEETALTVVAQFKRNDVVLEFECIDGGMVIIPAGIFAGVVSSTPAVRSYNRAHNAAMMDEKKAAGYFDE